MRKSVEADEKASYYEEKAESIENSNVISSDDPAALAKLKDKLAKLQKAQETMKSCNKIIANKKLSDSDKIESLKLQGLTEKQSIEIMKPDFAGRIGFPSFSLTNNNANMNTVKKRIQTLEKRATLHTTEKEVNGVKIVDNIEDNRLQAFFPFKPDESVRNELKHNGFRWSPSNECWQSFRNRSSHDALLRICEQFK